jgi:hypothetical protein
MKHASISSSADHGGGRSGISAVERIQRHARTAAAGVARVAHVLFRLLPLAHHQQLQSSSASRRTAGASGFLTFSQQSGGPERASYSISNKWPPPHTEAPTPVRGAGRAVNVAPPPNGGGRRYRIFFDNAWFQRTDVWGHRVTFLSNTSASRALDAVATSNLHCLVNGPEPVRKSTGDPNRPLRAFCACPAFAELDERWIPKSATDIAG